MKIRKQNVNAAIRYIKEKQLSGRLHGPTPFGYFWKSYPEKRYMGKRINPKADLLIDKNKAIILKDIFQLFSTNFYNYVSLATEINKKYKGSFSNDYIKDILHNNFYNGYLRNGLRHNYPRIISDELFNQTKKIIEIRKKFGINKRSKNTHKYSGILSCFYCNTTLSRQLHRDRSFYRCFGYKNISKKNHAKRNFAEKDLDLEFKFFFKKLFSDGLVKDAIPNSLKKEVLNIEENQKLFKMLFEHISIDNDMKITYALWNFKTDNNITDLATQSAEKPKKIVDENASLTEKIIRFSAIPQTIDSLAELLNKPISDIQIALIDLELEGKIEQHIEGYWKVI